MDRTQEKFRKAIRTGVIILALWFFVILLILISTPTDTIVSRSVPTENTALVLPEGFSATPESFEGGEILYHLNITGIDDKVRGYFEILTMGTDLESYLENAEKYKSADIDRFQILRGDRLGSVVWEYTTPKSNVRTFFIKKEQRLYVLTLSADKDKVDMNKLREYFTEVLNGLVI